MKIVLLKDVPNLGEEGDVCEVKNGYARNYLLPKKYALFCDAQSLSIIEGRKIAIEQRKSQKREQSQSVSDKLQSSEFFLKVRAADSGKIYGSVTATNILEELAKQGIQLEKKNIVLPHRHIRQVGKYPIRIQLYGGITASCVLHLVDESTAAQQEAEQQETAQEEKAALDTVHEPKKASEETPSPELESAEQETASDEPEADFSEQEPAP